MERKKMMDKAELVKIIKKLDEVEEQIDRTVSEGLKKIEAVKMSNNSGNPVKQLKSDLFGIWSLLWKKAR